MAQLSGCDLGGEVRPNGPALHIVEVRPADGDGVNCNASEPDCGVPRRTDIVVRFDRPLWPEPRSFEGTRVYTGTRSNRVPVAAVRYDLLDWTLTYQLGRQLMPRALYRVELSGAGESAAPRAYDGAVLDEVAPPLAFSFLTRSTPGGDVPSEPAPAPACDEVVRVLDRHCASGCCHGGEAPAMGLRLDSRDGLLTTAFRRVAHQTESTGTVGVPHSNPARFGTAMPLIDPGSAATSYLLYKLLIAPENLEPCAGDHCAASGALVSDETCLPWPSAERERLRDWFVRGEPMPMAPERLGCDGPALPLDCGSLRALVRFIDSGALCN